jgi:hypothetical protein
MRFKSKLVFAISLVVAVVLVAVMVSVLLLTHVVNKPSTPAPISPPISIYLGPPIYVVGPQSLIQRLVGVGIPQSKIAPTSLGQLPNLPNNSVVMIDWSVIRPYVAYGTVGGNITLNLASPVVGLLEGLIAKGDLVLVNVSRSEAPIAELLLSYTMAKGANVTFYGPNGAHFYLIPMLEMPVNSNYTLIGATAIRTPYGVAVLVGPVNLEGLPNLFWYWLWSIEAAKGDKPSTNQDPSDGFRNVGPCYVTYWYFLGWLQSWYGVHPSGNFIFLWDLQSLENQVAIGISAYDYGIAAVQDNYGDTFYYDSCIVMKNSLTSIRPAFIDAELLGDVAYYLTNNGSGGWVGPGALWYLIGGFDMYKSHEATINYPSFYNAYITDSYGQYMPTPTGFFPTRLFNIGDAFLSDIPVNYAVPTSAWGGVLIGVSTTPYYVNEAGEYAYNLTWTFDYAFLFLAARASGAYIDGFRVGPGGTAAVWLKNYSPGNTYWFYLPFNAEVETSCWRAWANTAWVVGFVAPSSNTVLINTVYLGYPLQQPSNAPSGTWISGYTNHCPSTVNLSGP